MALRPGEDLVATLFADVHYFYGPPSAKPPHHRFDKESYVYLFEKPSQYRARVEIANNAGTPDQDAFSGYLDGVHVEYSYKRTNLVSITVESLKGSVTRNGPIAAPEWHLPTFDPKNENKYMYKLHSMDIYFWAKEDALVFVNAAQRLLAPQQLTILDKPITPAPHRDAISPVVQKLENVAVSDPGYQNGQTRDSRSNLPAFAGPPISATTQSQPAAFTPFAYNPAAPAAPEVIKHREKTPPPEDGVANPLLVAANVDQYGHSNLPGPPAQPPSQASYFPNGAVPAPPSNNPSHTTAQSPYAHHFQNQFAGPPKEPITSPLVSPPSNTSPSHHTNQQQQQQFTSFPLSSPAPGSTSLPGSFPQTPQPQSPPQNVNPVPGQAPPGGYSTFTYGSTATSGTRPMQNDHTMHSQVYRPTEVESTIKHNDKPAAPGAPQGKLEARASKLEKGVGGFLKKLEKKYG